MHRDSSEPVLAGVRYRLDIAPEVAAALAAGRPVVALESTLISHGLPYPQSVEVARAAEAAVLESGAVPATVGIHGGRIVVGLDDRQLVTLATTEGVMKAARPSLSLALAGGGWAATTVSATMIAAAAAGIGVFAT
jgi:pseudouridylate synthase